LAPKRQRAWASCNDGANVGGKAECRRVRRRRESGYVFTAMLRPNRGLFDSVAVGRYPAALQLTGNAKNITNQPTTSVCGCILPELRWGVFPGAVRVGGWAESSRGLDWGPGRGVGGWFNPPTCCCCVCRWAQCSCACCDAPAAAAAAALSHSGRDAAVEGWRGPRLVIRDMARCSFCMTYKCSR
jgi:hypothetical protein